MTNEELWQAIREHNRRQKIREQKLTEIRNLLPPTGETPGIRELVVILEQIREIMLFPS